MVPTPTKPELAESSPDVFAELSKVTEPKHGSPHQDADAAGRRCGLDAAADVKNAATADGYACRSSTASESAPSTRPVLKADDPDELLKWLEKNGYHAGPSLKEWLKIYTADKWVLTAFKIATNEKEHRLSNGRMTVAGSAVRMSVRGRSAVLSVPRTRGPAGRLHATGRSMWVPGGRMLRIYVFADARMDGVLGKGVLGWPGRAVWANPIDKATFASAAKAASCPRRRRPTSARATGG